MTSGSSLQLFLTSSRDII